MPRQNPLDAWTEQVVDAFPRLSRPQATVLALYSFGMFLAQRCGLNAVVAALVPLLGVGFPTLRSRLQEFYQPAAAKSGTRRDELDVTTCFAPLLAWTLKGWPSTRLALALDATSLGDRFTVLSISVVYRGSAIPVAWKVLPANVAHPWKPEWLALLGAFSELVPPGWTVVVMTDRGLYARWLYRAIVGLGWHPLMRITKCGKFRKQGGRAGVPVDRLVPKRGRRWQGRGTAFPRKSEKRLECTLLARWDEGYDEPWFVLTDLGPEQAEGLWYGMRAWIEHGFKLLKSAGWQWQATRMTDCDRAERLWLVLAVATRYVLAVGGAFEAAQEIPVETIPEMTAACAKAGRAGDAPSRARVEDQSPSQARRPKSEAGAPRLRASGTKERPVSVFRQGLSVLLAVLIAGHPLPNPQWKPEPWLEIQAEIKPSAGQPPTPIPKNPSL
jgi:Transposase DDE domain